MAALAQTVVEAHRALERQQREAERRLANADARMRAAEDRAAELEAEHAPGIDALRDAYRRGYRAGYYRGRSGRSEDVEAALADPRNQLRVVS